MFEYGSCCGCPWDGAGTPQKHTSLFLHLLLHWSFQIFSYSSLRSLGVATCSSLCFASFHGPIEVVPQATRMGHGVASMVCGSWLLGAFSIDLISERQVL